MKLPKSVEKNSSDARDLEINSIPLTNADTHLNGRHFFVTTE